MQQLRRIDAVFGVTESASVEDTRTIIEDKLRELDKDPSKVQVIEGEDNDGM